MGAEDDRIESHFHVNVNDKLVVNEIAQEGWVE